MTEQTDKPNYKNTINRPKTSFAMKANLVQREPEFEKRWAKMGLYERMREATQQRSDKRFVFHDGPPYANGDIHIGHLLNKVLKDLVVRTKLMAGFDTPFVPGWDCHGLPIEHRVMKELGDAAKTMEPIQIRRKCKSYAEKFVKRQAAQMQRLGTIGEYDNPYITMDPAYEAATIEVFADLVEKGLVYRALKPVHWSIANQTALADAELEYYDREDTSVYVLFTIEDRAACGLAPPEGSADAPVDLMIWTTTPWTLPANMAVAVSERAEYSLFEYYRNGETRYVIMAEDLHKQVFEKEGLATSAGHKRLGTVKGSELVGMTYQHPFIDRVSPVVAADYVTLEDGTGLVHTAPGHGVEDYQTGRNYELTLFGNRVHAFLASEGFADIASGDTTRRKWQEAQSAFAEERARAKREVGTQGVPYCPVKEDGTFDATAPDWLQGKSVWDANPLVVEKLRESGHLFHDHQFMHSYPHDWRSKTPTIFRATEQWFIGVERVFPPNIGMHKEAEAETLRDAALRVTKEDVTFIPDWGRNRMRGMLDSRPDWCISRQRAWGLPIPAFRHKETGEALLTADSVRHIANLFRAKGSDVWFLASAEELLDGCPGVDNPADYEKGHDIFDVWFESGSSWHACMRQRGLSRDEGPHTDLYLEGSDQHRGWFQLSLLPALGATGRPPFGTVLTHGFMVDARGEKMSKSGGNAINVEDLMKDYGADVCRWWVASLNYANDVKVDWEFFRLAGEEYRKVRNTIRFLLSNLDDFDPAADRRELTPQDAHTIDAWAWGEYGKLVATVRKAYDSYNFRVANEAVFDFCNETMSAIYLAASKDRLYCDAVGSDRRRRTQTVMYDIVEGLIRLVAPILVHTADEAWLALHGLDTKSDETVHTQAMPEAPHLPGAGAEGWADVMALRDRVLKHIEDARAQRGIDNPLDVGVTVFVPGETYAKLCGFERELADLCGVSRFKFVENGSETVDIEDLRDEPRCDRSWKRDGTVKQRSDGGWLSDRDAAAVGVE